MSTSVSTSQGPHRRQCLCLACFAQAIRDMRAKSHDLAELRQEAHEFFADRQAAQRRDSGQASTSDGAIPF